MEELYEEIRHRANNIKWWATALEKKSAELKESTMLEASVWDIEDDIRIVREKLEELKGREADE